MNTPRVIIRAGEKQTARMSFTTANVSQAESSYQGWFMSNIHYTIDLNANTFSIYLDNPYRITTNTSYGACSYSTTAGININLVKIYTIDIEE